MVGASSQIYEDEELTKLRSAVASEQLGIGAPIVIRFLSGVPKINESSVTAQLANFKASGNYEFHYMIANNPEKSPFER
jgi:hypothetical protein